MCTSKFNLRARKDRGQVLLGVRDSQWQSIDLTQSVR
jgi:hypothetical protein